MNKPKKPKKPKRSSRRRLAPTERDRLTRVLMHPALADPFYESHREGDDPPSVQLFALVSSQGTACSETCLCARCDSPRARAVIDAAAARDPSPDAPISGSWRDVSENDHLCCVRCDVDNSGHKEVKVSPFFALFEDED